MRHMGKQGPCGFHIHVSQLLWWQGHSTTRVLDTQCVSSWALVKTGPSSALQPSAALSVGQKNLAYLPLRIHLGHWSLLCTRNLSTHLKDPLPARRCECLVVCYALNWQNRDSSCFHSDCFRPIVWNTLPRKQRMDSQSHDRCRKLFFLTTLHTGPQEIA